MTSQRNNNSKTVLQRVAEVCICLMVGLIMFAFFLAVVGASLFGPDILPQ